MRMMSTGQPHTLGNTRALAVAVFGSESPAVKFLDDQIAKYGEGAEVMADETQLVHMLGQLHFAPQATDGEYRK